MNNNCKILLLTDIPESFDELIKVIKVKISDVEMADNENIAVQYFDSMKPDVIVFYHTSIDISTRWLSHMYNTSKAIQESRYRAILMCESNTVPIAVKKCIDNIFYDYLAFNPAHDRFRINLLIKKSFDSIAHENYDTKNREFSRLGKEIQENSGEVLDSISEMHEANKGNQKILDKVTEKVCNNIKSYSSKLVTDNSNSPSPLTDAEINKSAEKFSKENVVDTINDSRKAIDTTLDDIRARLEQNKKKYQDALSKLEELSNSVTKKVLLVEDNEIYGEIVRTMLEKTGSYEVEVNTSINQSISYMTRELPDVILLDYELDDGDAGDFLERITDIPSAKNIPIIMLTSHATDDV